MSYRHTQWLSDPPCLWSSHLLHHRVVLVIIIVRLSHQAGRQGASRISVALPTSYVTPPACMYDRLLSSRPPLLLVGPCHTSTRLLNSVWPTATAPACLPPSPPPPRRHRHVARRVPCHTSTRLSNSVWPTATTPSRPHLLLVVVVATWHVGHHAIDVGEHGKHEGSWHQERGGGGRQGPRGARLDRSSSRSGGRGRWDGGRGRGRTRAGHVHHHLQHARRRSLSFGPGASTGGWSMS